MKEGITVNDVLVVQDGQNPSFYAYMDQEETQRIQALGSLSNADRVCLKDTEERPIPQSLKKGESFITDIQVKLEPNIVYYLN